VCTWDRDRVPHLGRHGAEAADIPAAGALPRSWRATAAVQVCARGLRGLKDRLRKQL